MFGFWISSGLSVQNMYQKQLEIGRYKSITLLLPQRAVNSSFQSDKMNIELQSLYVIAIGSLTIQLGNL